MLFGTSFAFKKYHLKNNYESKRKVKTGPLYLCFFVSIRLNFSLGQQSSFLVDGLIESMSEGSFKSKSGIQSYGILDIW